PAAAVSSRFVQHGLGPDLLRACHGDSDRVEQAPLRLLDHLRRQVLEAQADDVLGKALRVRMSRVALHLSGSASGLPSMPHSLRGTSCSTTHTFFGSEPRTSAKTAVILAMSSVFCL